MTKDSTDRTMVWVCAEEGCEVEGCYGWNRQAGKKSEEGDYGYNAGGHTGGQCGTGR